MFVVWRCSDNRFLLLSIPGSEQLLINICSFLSTALKKATAPETQEQANKTAWNCCTHKFYPWWSILHSIFITCWHTAVYSLLWSYILCLHFWIVFIMTRISWNRGSQYWGSVQYILLLFWLGWRKLFVVPRTLLYRGSLNRSSSVTRLLIGGLNSIVLSCTVTFNFLQGTWICMGG